MDKYDEKIAKFVADKRTKLDAGIRPSHHLNKILQLCGWKRKSSTNLARIQAALQEDDIYPEPMLTAPGLARNELVYFTNKEPRPYSPEEYAPKLAFATEQGLEAFIFHNFDSIPAFAALKNPIRQFRLRPGKKKIDILARGRKNNNYVVIELKKADENPIGQLLEYMAYVKRHWADREGVDVEGLIISRTPNRTMEDELGGAIGDYPVKWLHYTVDLQIR